MEERESGNSSYVTIGCAIYPNRSVFSGRVDNCELNVLSAMNLVTPSLNEAIVPTQQSAVNKVMRETCPPVDKE